MLCTKKHLLFAFLMIIATPLFSMDKPPVPPAPTGHFMPSTIAIGPNFPSVTPLQLLSQPTAAATIAAAQQTTAGKQPARKRLSVDSQTHQQPPAVRTVFEVPSTLANIFNHLTGSDASRFARISKTCQQTAYLNPCRREEYVAELLENGYTPITNVLKLAQGKKYVRVFGIDCNTEKLINLLHQKGTVLDEFIVDFAGELSDLEPDVQQRKTTLGTLKIAKLFSHEEITYLKPTQRIQAIFTNVTTEDQVIKQIEDQLRKDKTAQISLELHPLDAPGQIRPSLINKLAKFSIVALWCEDQQFPEGIACLAALKQLRVLSLRQCNLFGNTQLPEELFKELSSLTILIITKCGLTELPASIGGLAHLRILNLNKNSFTSLPEQLHNLNKLKVLSLCQENPLPTTITQCLPNMDGMIRLELPTTNPEINLIPDSANMEHVEDLSLSGSINRETGALVGSIEQLVRHPEKFKKLETLLLCIANGPAFPAFEFPVCIAKLPSLNHLSGHIPANTIIPYEALLLIAHQVDSCRLFAGINKPIEIKMLAELWQLIQSNINLLETIHISDLLKNANLQMFDILRNRTITCNNIVALIDNPESMFNCNRFIRSLLENRKQKIGTAETCAIIQELHQEDPKFATVLSYIAQTICVDTPVCMDAGNTNEVKAQLMQLPTFKKTLRDLARTANEVMQTIDQNNVISDAQWENCDNQLNICCRSADCFDCCHQLLANLFFHHAVEQNNITNAQIMLNNHAEIDGTISPSADTPLHVAIRNRELAQDDETKEQFDHLICFLIKNKASTEVKNSRQQTPLDLIAPNSSLAQKIAAWRLDENL